MQVDRETEKNESVLREISSHEEIDEQHAVGSSGKAAVQPAESNEVDSHSPSEPLNGSTNFPDNNDAVEASMNEQRGQEDDAPTGIHRYPQRVRKAPTRFTINAFTRKYDSDEPRTRDTVHDEDKRDLLNAINNEVNTLEKMNCWNIVDEQIDENILNKIFFKSVRGRGRSLRQI